jgi:hypothetical protein
MSSVASVWEENKSFHDLDDFFKYVQKLEDEIDSLAFEKKYFHVVEKLAVMEMAIKKLQINIGNFSKEMTSIKLQPCSRWNCCDIHSSGPVRMSAHVYGGKRDRIEGIVRNIQARIGSVYSIFESNSLRLEKSPESMESITRKKKLDSLVEVVINLREILFYLDLLQFNLVTRDGDVGCGYFGKIIKAYFGASFKEIYPKSSAYSHMIYTPDMRFEFDNAKVEDRVNFDSSLRDFLRHFRSANEKYHGFSILNLDDMRDVGRENKGLGKESIEGEKTLADLMKFIISHDYESLDRAFSAPSALRQDFVLQRTLATLCVTAGFSCGVAFFRDLSSEYYAEQLRNSICLGNVERARLCIERGADITAANFSIFELAVKQDQFKILAMMYSNTPDPTLRSCDERLIQLADSLDKKNEADSKNHRRRQMLEVIFNCLA